MQAEGGGEGLCEKDADGEVSVINIARGKDMRRRGVKGRRSVGPTQVGKKIKKFQV